MALIPLLAKERKSPSMSITNKIRTTHPAAWVHRSQTKSPLAGAPRRGWTVLRSCTTSGPMRRSPHSLVSFILLLFFSLSKSSEKGPDGVSQYRPNEAKRMSGKGGTHLQPKGVKKGSRMRVLVSDLEFDSTATVSPPLFPS